MMKNKLTDLNNHLFEQLERLNDENLTAEDLAHEVTRTDSIVKVVEQIISNASLAVRGAALIAEHSGRGTFEHLMPMLCGDTKVVEGSKK
jgi:hypothetical protein